MSNTNGPRETAAASYRAASPRVDEIHGYKLVDGKPHALTDIGLVCIDAKTGFAASDPIFRGLSFDERSKHWKKTKTAREFMRTTR